MMQGLDGPYTILPALYDLLGISIEQKKARIPWGCGLNPIHEDLEETSAILFVGFLPVCFIVTITDIRFAYICNCAG
jgi:hypothetical protein